MKNVLSFMLGMAASVIVIKLAAKDDKYYDDFYDFDFEEDEDMAENKKRKYPINIAEEARKKARKSLLLEQDYELASLYDAIQTQDEVEQERSKARLAEIASELEAL